ncbi:MAG: hypothetical protein IT452_06340 [Planctomycetia bacterium]|nr:hypothetical protein [Planctomycetia bacterium]
MKRVLLAAAAVAVALGCERKAGRIGAIPFGVDAAAALAQGKAEGKPVFLEFWADD